MPRLPARPASGPLLLGLLVALVIAALCLTQRVGAWVPGAAILDRVERVTLDLRFRARGPIPAGDEIVIVLIDDRTLDNAPQLGEKREGTRQLIDAIARHDPRVIGVDMLFAKHERLLPEELSARIDAFLERSRGAPTDEARELLTEVQRENSGDAALERAIAGAERVVLALHLGARGDPIPDDPSLRKARYGQSVLGVRRPDSVARSVASLPEFNAAAAALGVVTLVEDDDRTVRAMPFAVRVDGEPSSQVYAPFAVPVLATYDDARRAQLAYLGVEHEVRIGQRRVALDDQDNLLVNFRGPAGAFTTLSAYDVVEGELGGASLKDKIVLVGVSFLGKDRVRTPFGPGSPGVELHATVVDQALRGDALQRASPLLDALVCALVGLLVAGLFAPRLRLGPVARVVGVLSAALLYAVFAQLMFVSAGRWIAAAWPLLNIAIVGAGGLTVSYLREAFGRRQLRRSFANYLGDDALKELLADPRALELGGARRPVTVLFSDIRGFTELSERLSPEQLVTVLNTFLTPMTRAVLARGGYLDKYIGDAVMAVFGAPVSYQDHAARCLATAIAMDAALRELQPGFRAQGLEVAMGVGVNTGDAVVGNMGSAERFDYTAVGDTVNLASRLEGLTKVYGVRCLVGPETRASAPPEYSFREVDLVRVKGKEVPVAIFELLAGPEGAVASYEELPRFEDALAAYRAGRFAEARAGFEAFAARNDGERTAALYLERLRELGDAAPEGWDGIATFTRK